jgi:hypothetical protein
MEVGLLQHRLQRDKLLLQGGVCITPRNGAFSCAARPGGNLVTPKRPLRINRTGNNDKPLKTLARTFFSLEKGKRSGHTRDS